MWFCAVRSVRSNLSASASSRFRVPSSDYGIRVVQDGVDGGAKQKGRRTWRVYLVPSLQLPAMNRIFMEALPFLECGFGARVVVGRVPLQHGVGVVETDAATVGGDDAGWVVEEVVGVDDANFDLVVVVLRVGGGTVDAVSAVGPVDAVDAVAAVDSTIVIVIIVVHISVAAVAIGVLPGDVGPDLADTAEIVEDAADFVVAGFGRHEVVKSRNFVERGDRATIVRRNAGSRVADQEGEVELLEDSRWNHGRVVWLRGGGVGIRRCGDCAVGPVRTPVGLDGGGVGGGRSRGRQDRAVLCADALLSGQERGGDGGRFAVRRDEIVGNVLD